MKQVELMEDGTLIVRTKLLPDVKRVMVEQGKECALFYADSVEVGKCRDCRKMKTMNSGVNVCSHFGAVVKPDGYCNNWEKIE